MSILPAYARNVPSSVASSRHKTSHLQDCSNPGGTQRIQPDACRRPPTHRACHGGRLSRVLSRGRPASASQAERAGARKPLSVVRRIEGSNPSPSAPRAESHAGDRVAGPGSRAPGSSRKCTGTSRDPLTRPLTGARAARVGRPRGAGAAAKASGLSLSDRVRGTAGGALGSSTSGPGHLGPPEPPDMRRFRRLSRHPPSTPPRRS